MKIVTWNINSVRLRLNLLTELINKEQPDIILLQETKVEEKIFPREYIVQLGYNNIYYSGQKSYNGVAILSKIPGVEFFNLELYNNDKRHIALKLADVEIHNFYFPAGGDIADIDINPKFKHKLGYIKLVEDWFTNNRSNNTKIILGGDLNIAPNEHDVWSSKQLKNVVSHTAIERTMLLEMQKRLNLIDSARFFVPLEEKFYTWWSYRNLDWKKSNRGRKLDHIMVSENLTNQLRSIKLLAEFRENKQPSDHVPYMIDIDI